MDKLTSILAVIDPTDESRHGVVKAMVLARHFGARLELFLCESELAFSLRHAYHPSGVADARRACLERGERYLDAVRRSLAEDVHITTYVACASPLYEAVVHRVQETHPDLVIKSASGHHAMEPASLDANDWQLARTCPVPLLLTRGRPWSARSRFAAAVDIGDPNNAGLARSILKTASFLTRGCGGQLDVIYSEPDAADPRAFAARRETLDGLMDELQLDRDHSYLLAGDADETLPGFAAKQDYDLVFLGALTHRPATSALVGTLTGRLVDSLACDFVLVKSDEWVSPVIEPAQAIHA